MTIHPPQRRIPVRVHTGPGWLAGTLHVPKAVGFADFLAFDEPALALTEVTLPGQRAAVPFFALRKAAADLLEPACAEWLVGLGAGVAGTVERMVTCLLEAGAVTGRLELPGHQRVSDFVAGHPGFLVLRGAVMGPNHLPAPLLLVNAGACIGVGDLGPGGPRAPAPGEVRTPSELADPPAGPAMPA